MSRPTGFTLIEISMTIAIICAIWLLSPTTWFLNQQVNHTRSLSLLTELETYLNFARLTALKRQHKITCQWRTGNLIIVDQDNKEVLINIPNFCDKNNKQLFFNNNNYIYTDLAFYPEGYINHPGTFTLKKSKLKLVIARTGNTRMANA